MTSTAVQAPRPTEGQFATTHWSVVLSAREKNAPQAAAALETLCRVYWYPLYAFIRRQGHSPEDAQDLTQEFFARLIAKDFLQAVQQERGKFRSFLLMACRRFLANEWDRARARKRGGALTFLSWDGALAEGRYQGEPVEGMTPETIYERRWALTLLDQTMARLRREFAQAGKEGEFDRLKPFLTAERGGIPYGELAAQLGQSEGAARVAIHRLRRRFRELFREEIAQTVSRPEDIDDEVRHLLGVLGE
jgi:RNA polymerase sigma-70 factor (ECF subfamily)